MSTFDFHLGIANDALNAAAELMAATEDAKHPRSHFLQCAGRWLRCARTNLSHAAAEMPAKPRAATQTTIPKRRSVSPHALPLGLPKIH